MNDKYKTYEELKEELGNNYDLFMYEINLCLLQKINKAIEYISSSNALGIVNERYNYYYHNKLDTTDMGEIFDALVEEQNELLKILGDKE